MDDAKQILRCMIENRVIDIEVIEDALFSFNRVFMSVSILL